MPWHKYQWRLCVSYQKMNQVTHLFTFPIPRCDDAVQDIDTEAKYFISVHMDSGHWQVVAEYYASERLELSTPDGNRRWKVIPMGYLDADSTFVTMIMKL